MSEQQTAFIRSVQAAGYVFVCPQKDRALTTDEAACEDCDCIASTPPPAEEKER